METSYNYLNHYNNPNSAAFRSHSIASSQRYVTYRCGACGFDLNLSSSSRNTSTIGSKYSKSMKKGIISFFTIDESRFTQVEQFRCLPFFKCSWGLFCCKTKLICRNCGNHIGFCYDDNKSSSSRRLLSDSQHLPSRKYDIRIRALQPGTPLFC